MSSEAHASQIEQLTRRARQVSEAAYCPYSRFSVGAALLTVSGSVYSGCNVENASYGLTSCAERNAIFEMVSHADRGVTLVVIYTPTPEPSAPCGACRQVLSELAPDALVVCVCEGERVLRRRVRELLPDAFGAGSFAGDTPGSPA